MRKLCTFVQLLVALSVFALVVGTSVAQQPVQDIDSAMVLGCGHPMGPLTLCDFVGIDTLCRISEIMFEEYRESRYAPPPLLRRLVAMERFGRKSGQGFYDWRGEAPVPLAI